MTFVVSVYRWQRLLEERELEAVLFAVIAKTQQPVLSRHAPASRRNRVEHVHDGLAGPPADPVIYGQLLLELFPDGVFVHLAKDDHYHPRLRVGFVLRDLHQQLLDDEPFSMRAR